MLTGLIARAGAQHEIPLALLAALVQVESGGDTWAMRFEPDFLDRYVPWQPQRFGAVSRSSERIARASSWGLMQIMGQVARERGFAMPHLPALCDPATGIEYGCRQLVWLRDRHHARHGWEGVAAAYNAGSPRKIDGGHWENHAYVDKLRLAGAFRGGAA